MTEKEQTQEILDPRFAELLLESMADGVFTLNQKGEITTWNRSMERITGYTADEAMGKSCLMLNFSRCLGQDKDYPSDFNKCGIYQYGKVAAKKCHMRHKDGYDVSVVKSASLVRDEDGTVLGVVETVTDLTELDKTRRKMEEAARRLGELHKFDNIIGQSHAMLRVFSEIKAAAASDASVMIQGESGTGKELVAGAVHYNSDRSNGPLVTVNCSALSESLLESELFGHVKGAFTGAHRDRVGRFEEAAGGTIFLDEIGDISPFIQVKLLRVLQEREIERVGESVKRGIDIRIIAATNRDLYRLVREGSFREDLYYRLKVFPITLPRLRDRKKDIPLLTDHFIEVQKQKTGKPIRGVSESAMRILMDYTWPGNVRELENAVEHAFVLCSGDWIDVFDLPVEIRQMEYQVRFPKTESEDKKISYPRKKLSPDLLRNILDESGWNKAEAGRRLGLSRTAIWKYMKKWGIPLKPPSI